MYRRSPEFINQAREARRWTHRPTTQAENFFVFPKNNLYERIKVKKSTIAVLTYHILFLHLYKRFKYFEV